MVVLFIYHMISGEDKIIAYYQLIKIFIMFQYIHKS